MVRKCFFGWLGFWVSLSIELRNISRFSMYMKQIQKTKYIFKHVCTQTYVNNTNAVKFWLRRNCCDKIHLCPWSTQIFSLQIKDQTLSGKGVEIPQEVRALSSQWHLLHTGQTGAHPCRALSIRAHRARGKPQTGEWLGYRSPWLYCHHGLGGAGFVGYGRFY